MNGKYITTQIRIACRTKQRPSKPDIHLQLAETIAERRSILERLANIGAMLKNMNLEVTGKAA